MSDAADSAAQDGAVAAWRLAVLNEGEGGPAPLPTGWFALVDGDALATGGVLGTRALGMELVLWRGEDGRARVLPARCPHAGVNMANGGKVHGNWIECPYHSWRWDEAGQLREVPYSIKQIKPKDDCPARWPTREQGGIVLVWHHPERAEPSWEPLVPTAERRLGFSVEWLIETDAATLHAAMLDALCDRPNAPMRKAPGDGRAQRITAPFRLRVPDDDGDGRVEVTGAGPGLAWFSHSALPAAGLLVAMTPVHAHVTRVRLAAASRGSAGDRAFAGTVTRRIDRVKAMLARRDRPHSMLKARG